MAASKLHKHSRTCYTAEWPYCPFAILWLQPSVVDPRKVEEKLKKKQERQKKYYDVGSRVLPSLQQGHTKYRQQPSTTVNNRQQPPTGRQIPSTRLQLPSSRCQSLFDGHTCHWLYLSSVYTSNL